MREGYSRSVKSQPTGSFAVHAGKRPCSHRALRLHCSILAALQHKSSHDVQHSLPPRQKEAHVIIRATSPITAPLQEAASAVSGLPQDIVRRLIHLGAVYYGDPDLPLSPGNEGLRPRWRRARDLQQEAPDYPIQQVLALPSIQARNLSYPKSADKKGCRGPGAMATRAPQPKALPRSSSNRLGLAGDSPGR